MLISQPGSAPTPSSGGSSWNNASTWGALASVAGSVVGLWGKREAYDEAQKHWEYQNYVNRRLAAEQLAVTYNSIMAKSIETGMIYKRKALDLRKQERAAEGEAIAAQAAQGIDGRRARLARQMAINGGAESKMTELEIDAKRAQDDLIHQAEREERATVNRLISNQPDMPVNEFGTDMLNFVGDIVDTGVRWFKENKAIDDLIVSGGATTQLGG